MTARHDGLVKTQELKTQGSRLKTEVSRVDARCACACCMLLSMHEATRGMEREEGGAKASADECMLLLRVVDDQ